MQAKRVFCGPPVVIAGLVGACSWGGASGQNGDHAGAAAFVDAAPMEAAAIEASTEGVPLPAIAVDISLSVKTPRVATWGINYWQWSPTYGDDVTGTDRVVAPLGASFLRIGGYNNDANTPDPFDGGQFDKAVAYARAIGAQPIVQVPLLGDTSGEKPTAATAAAMVQYGVDRGYGIKYYAIGSEPDIYADQGYLPGFAPGDYCTVASAYVTAMKAVDPSILIVGPDLAYKYEANDSDNDWLTPILQGCGQLFDVVSIHRYPYSSTGATLVGAARDVLALRSTVGSVRGLMQAAGYGSKPLALTETNLVYNATTTPLEASPGTVPAGLWLADVLGAALDEGLWTTAVWDASDPDEWALGLIGPAPAHTPRPAYYAMALYASHFGPTQVHVGATPTDVHIYASRNASDDATEVMVINWNTSPQTLALVVTDTSSPAAPAEATFAPTTMIAVEIPDRGTARAWTYGQDQLAAGTGPTTLAVTPAETLLDGGGDATQAVGAFDYTFDTPSGDPGFQLDSYVMTPPFTPTNPENIGAPGAGVAAAAVVASGGNPGGALSLSATFTDLNQIAGLSHTYATLQSFTGQVLHAQVKLASAAPYAGQVQLYVLTGADYAGYGTSYVPLSTNDWTDVIFPIDAPLFATASYDPTQVVALGVQITSDLPGADASSYGPPQLVTVLVDNIHN